MGAKEGEKRVRARERGGGKGTVILERLALNESQGGLEISTRCEKASPLLSLKRILAERARQKDPDDDTSCQPICRNRSSPESFFNDVASDLKSNPSTAPCGVDAAELKNIVLGEVAVFGTKQHDFTFELSKGVRIRKTETHLSSTDLSPGHFVELTGGNVIQLLCCFQHGDLISVVGWHFPAANELHPLHREMKMPHFRRALKGAEAIIIAKAAEIVRRPLVVPLFANQGINLEWSPSDTTEYIENTMVRHLDPIRGIVPTGCDPFRLCPDCSEATKQPTPPEFHSVCVKCGLRFRW